jgi:hypothetical protein
VTPVVAAIPGMLHDQTRQWAEQHGARVAWLERDSHAYWRLLHAEWTAPGDLLLIEHDMLPDGGVTDAMGACRRPWCTSPYRIAHSWLPDGLGCVKLAGRLKDRHPDLMDRLGEIADDGMPPKNWRRLDTRLSRLLRDLGYRPHCHRRSLHLHDYGWRP